MWLTNIDLSFFKPGVRPQVIHGMTLGDLLRVSARNDFRVDTKCAERLFYLLIVGALNSIYGTCETIFNVRANSRCRDCPPLYSFLAIGAAEQLTYTIF